MSYLESIYTHLLYWGVYVSLSNLLMRGFNIDSWQQIRVVKFLRSEVEPGLEKSTWIHLKSFHPRRLLPKWVETPIQRLCGVNCWKIKWLVGNWGSQLKERYFPCDKIHHQVGPARKNRIHSSTRDQW